MRVLQDLNVAGKRVLIRVDYNVPLEEGKILDDTRLRFTIPTIQWLLDHRASQIIIMSHLGRPGGQPNPEFSLSPVAHRLEKLLKMPVAFVDDCLGPLPDNAKIIMLENLRFYPGEKKNDPEFARKLAKQGDIYVDDAFANAHRAHASMVGVPALMPSSAGLLLEQELTELDKLRGDVDRPLVLFFGGVKLKTKLPVIEAFLERADRIFIGGAMAFTFLAAEGKQVGKSLVDQDFLDKAKTWITDPLFKEKVVLPVDVVASSDITGKIHGRIVPAGEIPSDLMGLDIGPQAIEDALHLIRDAGTVIWNGPLGLADIDAYEEGTKRIAQALAESDAKVIIGGGETVAEINKMGLANQFAHVSTGGGAFLRYLAGKELPAVAALK